jgi:hypothetical protein
MNSIVKKSDLEKLLLTNWTKFIDYQKLIIFVTQTVRDYNNFPIFEEDELPEKGVQITLTRFSILNNKFILWIDFTVPKQLGFVIGTCETTLELSGKMYLQNLVGQHLMIKPH